MTIISTVTLLALLWTELASYLYGERAYSFAVDNQLQSTMQINMDMTVAMKCHYLTIDVRDAVGDRLHVSDSEFTKDGTTFEIGHADRLDAMPRQELSVEKTINQARKRPLYRKKPKNKNFLETNRFPENSTYRTPTVQLAESTAVWKSNALRETFTLQPWVTDI